MNYNRVMLGGNITREIEVRYLESGMAIAKIEALSAISARLSAFGQRR